MKQFEFSTLRAFVAVAEAGSISQASEDLNLAIAAVSKRIIDLEASAKVALFYRHARGVRLTPAGQALLHEAKDLLLRVDVLRANVSEYSRGVEGHVRMAVNESAISQCLPADIKAFLDRHPRLTIPIIEQNSDGVISTIEHGRADIGVFVDEAVHARLVTFPYYTDELCMVAPTTHELARRRRVRFDDLLDYDFIGLEYGSRLFNLLLKIGGPRLRFRIQVRSFDSICRMVGAGLGIAIVPRRAVEPHESSRRVRAIRLDEDWAHRQLLLGVRALESLPQPARRLLDHLRSAHRRVAPT